MTHTASRPSRARRRLFAASAVATVLAVGACSGGAGSATSASDSAAVGAPEPARALGGDEAAGALAETAAQSTGEQPASLPEAAVAAGRDVIRTASITVRADDRRRARAAALTAVAARGGSVSDEQSGYDPGADGASFGSTQLTVRVPVDSYSALLDDLAGLGDLLDLQQSSQDVSDQVVDVKSRIASQTASVQRVRDLLAQAGDLGDVLQVEAELARREADLEALQARFAALTDSAALSTVTLTLIERADAATDPSDDDDGFLAGLSAGWDAFVSSATALATAVGAVLPFAVLVLVLGAGAVVARRRFHGRTTAADSAGA